MPDGTSLEIPAVLVILLTDLSRWRSAGLHRHFLADNRVMMCQRNAACVNSGPILAAFHSLLIKSCYSTLMCAL